jgi:biofilm PGA synthesis N-glycosyltransferase PgaC
MEIFQDKVTLVFLILFLSAFIVQIFYYLYFFLSIQLKKRSEAASAGDKPVSVIICARNEAENLRILLPLILEQEYPDFEVVVVNDCSEDESEYILNQLLEKYKHLKVTSIVKDQKFIHGKKLALTVGIKAARNEWLLLTDADCRPESVNWISCMSEHFTEKNDLVLGYGGFEYGKGILNNIIRYDSLFIAMQYLGFAIRGFTYMGVGRNLAYRKSVYNDNKGFSSHHELRSGDDDLFINEVSRKARSSVEYRKAAQTRTKAKGTLREWWYQKKRHMTTGSRYKLGDKFLLILEPLSRLLFYAMFIVLLINRFDLWITLGTFSVRMILQLLIVNFTMRNLNERFLLLPSLIYDILLPFFYLGIFISNLFNPRGAKWNSGQIYPKKRNRILS